MRPDGIHFISGLPRSGSTLLAAILRQNPCIHAGMSGPLADVLISVLRAMSASETALFISDQQRRQVLGSILQAFYCEHEAKVIFDTNRNWCALLAVISELLPAARVICCVRNPAWILDSVERLVQRNAFRASKMFAHDVGNIYARVEAMTKNGFLGPALSAFRQAWFGEHAEKLIVVRYESLAGRPSETIRELYGILGLARFDHNFEKVEYDAPEFDERLEMPGMHRVQGKVENRPRKTVLPPDLFNQFQGAFWDQRGQNPRGVTVL